MRTNGPGQGTEFHGAGLAPLDLLTMNFSWVGHGKANLLSSTESVCAKLSL